MINNILISGKPSGRIGSNIALSLRAKQKNIDFQENIFDLRSDCSFLRKYDLYIACAWNTKSGYKSDPINEQYALNTNFWLDRCRDYGVKTIYLGCSEKSGFEKCLYRDCKKKCEDHADVVLRIPFVWQPYRIGSFAWKISNGIPMKIQDGKFIFIPESKIVETVLRIIDLEKFDEHIVEFDHPSEPLDVWIKRLG